MAITFRPIYDRVLIRRSPEEEVSKGGIIIPGNAKEKPAHGEVIAVGPGRQLDSGGLAPMSVKPGDKVVFGKYAGSEIKLDGVEHWVLREEEILGIEEEVAC